MLSGKYGVLLDMMPLLQHLQHVTKWLLIERFRRPFDLGDRISISNPNERSSDVDPGYDDMWLVEDCNLFTTTLRLARTNEISYLNNGMLSNCKIINHGRSVNSLVNLLVPIRLEATQEQIRLVKSSLVRQGLYAYNVFTYIWN